MAVADLSDLFSSLSSSSFSSPSPNLQTFSPASFSTFFSTSSINVHPFPAEGDVGGLPAVTAWLWRTVPPVLLLLGTVGNVTAFLVLQSRTFRGSAVRFILSVLTVVDTCLLWSGLLRNWLLYNDTDQSAAGLDVRSLSVFTCKSHFFITHFLSHLSSWTVAVLSIERAVSVGAPCFLVSTALCRCLSRSPTGSSASPNTPTLARGSSGITQSSQRSRRSFVSWFIVAGILFAVNANIFWSVYYVSAPSSSFNSSSDYFSGEEQLISEELLDRKGDDGNINFNDADNHPSNEIRIDNAQADIKNQGFYTSIAGPLASEDSGETQTLYTTTAAILHTLFSTTGGQQTLSTTNITTSLPDKLHTTIAKVINIDDFDYDNVNETGTKNISKFTAFCSPPRTSARHHKAGYCFTNSFLKSATWYWLDTTLLALMPFLLIVIGNASIAARLRRSTADAQELGRYEGGGRFRPTKLVRHRMTSSMHMLSAVSLVFLITTTPIVIYSVFIQTWMKNADCRKLAVLSLLHCACNLIYYTGNSVNFLLYCVSGSRFRHALSNSFRQTLRCLTCRNCRMGSRGGGASTTFGEERVVRRRSSRLPLTTCFTSVNGSRSTPVRCPDSRRAGSSSQVVASWHRAASISGEARVSASRTSSSISRQSFRLEAGSKKLSLTPNDLYD